MGRGLPIKSHLGLPDFVIQAGVPLRGAEAGLCAAIRARHLPTAQAGAGFPLQSLTHASTEVISQSVVQLLLTTSSPIGLTHC